MEQTSGRPSDTGDRAGGGNSPPLMPPAHEIILLLLKAERLSSAATQAIEAGDSATAALMTAEMMAALKEARQIAERMRAL